MTDKYIIKTRYEYFTSDNGKQFTDWFVFYYTPVSYNEAEHLIEQFIETYKSNDKITKQNHEYKIVSYNEYKNELNAIIQSANESSKKADEYRKTDEYKQSLKRKREQAKERKQRQQNYIAQQIEKLK